MVRQNGGHSQVTAYDFPSGRFARQAGVELVLVGDSLGAREKMAVGKGGFISKERAESEYLLNDQLSSV